MSRLRFLVPVLILSLLLSACGTSDPPPTSSAVLAVMLSAMEDTAQPLPDGIIRISSAPADSPECLTETLLTALYGPAAHGLMGGGGGEGQHPPVMDVALFLSMTSYPCELAVFLCADSDTAQSVAVLCRGRLDTVARGYKDTPWADAAAVGRVAIRGSYVLLALCEDPEATLNSATRALP